jgi:putative mycofactocin binding protein MftB
MLAREDEAQCIAQGVFMSSQSPARYRLISEVKIRREAFGGILYKYGCADRGALSFINSPQLIELLLAGQQQFQGDLNAAIESHSYSAGSKQKLYAALDDLARRGYVLVGE